MAETTPDETREPDESQLAVRAARLLVQHQAGEIGEDQLADGLQGALDAFRAARDGRRMTWSERKRAEPFRPSLVGRLVEVAVIVALVLIGCLVLQVIAAGWR